RPEERKVPPVDPDVRGVGGRQQPVEEGLPEEAVGARAEVDVQVVESCGGGLVHDGGHVAALDLLGDVEPHALARREPGPHRWNDRWTGGSGRRRRRKGAAGGATAHRATRQRVVTPCDLAGRLRANAGGGGPPG